MVYPGTKPLTPKQKKLLAFIESFYSKKGYAPSQKEIAAHFGFSSLGTVQNYLVRLEKFGFLSKTWNAKRAIQIQPSVPNHINSTDSPNPNSPNLRLLSSQEFERPLQENPLELELLGRVAAGYPIEAIENARPIEVPRNMIKAGNQYYVLQVQGDSMIEDGILNGDYVVVRKTQTAAEGEIVIALVDNEATIKRLRRWSGRVELHPANPRFQPIIVQPHQDFRIQGVFAGLIRNSHFK